MEGWRGVDTWHFGDSEPEHGDRERDRRLRREKREERRIERLLRGRRRKKRKKNKKRKEKKGGAWEKKAKNIEWSV
jgi:hypothetical protein